jgi:hypothetical protein
MTTKTYRLKLANGGWSEEITYAQICHRLNISADVKFVKVTSAGTIGGTAGKMSEFKTLLNNIRSAQYVPTKRLVQLFK